jgi:tight adherence protein B
MNTVEILILFILFSAIAYFVHTGIQLFSKGWSGYEEKYIKGAEQNLESMYLTIPAQNILYLSVASFLLVSLFVSLFSGSWTIGIMLGVASFFIPFIALKFLKKRRDSLFAIQLVGGLGAMANAIKAGLSLPQAIDVIHREMDNPIAQEFKVVAHEIHFGADIVDALKNLEERMPNPDLALIVTAISVAREVGGNLSEIFDNISNTIRERQTLDKKVKAITAQGKMQGTALCLVPIMLGGLLTYMYPEMMAPMYETTIGIMLLVMSALMLIVGWFFIVKLTTIDF